MGLWNDRHRIKMVNGDLDIDKIVEEGPQKKVLVICNTVTKAQKLYMDIIRTRMSCLQNVPRRLPRSRQRRRTLTRNLSMRE